MDNACIGHPHRSPKGMTAGRMTELLSSKAGVLAGEMQYGTVFGGRRVEDMSYVHVRNGCSFSGQDLVSNGITSSSLPAGVFFGLIYIKIYDNAAASFLRGFSLLLLLVMLVFCVLLN